MKRTPKTAPAAKTDVSTHDAAAQAELTQMVAKGKKSKGKKPPVVTEAAAPAATPSKKQGSTATTKAPAATDRGAVKRVIIEAASTAYAALPKSATAKDVLAMRVKVMDELQEKGVKRTTASCMLGEWQKSLPAAQQLPVRAR